MHNEIVLHCDKGTYVGGEVVHGVVLLHITHAVAAKALMFEIKGYEKVKWVEHRTEQHRNADGSMHSKTVTEKRHGSSEFFCDHVPLISYPGGFPAGTFSYPFQYRLPDTLPGVFRVEQKGHDKFKAKIAYKVKAVLEVGHGKELKTKAHLYVNERLDLAIAPRHHFKKKQVRTCCCIPRGEVSCEAYMDKNAYMAGERAQVHVDVNNESAVRVRHFSTKLIREIHLRDGRGHSRRVRTIVCRAQYDGCDAESKKASDVPLDLVPGGSRRAGCGPIEPSTSSKLVACEYKLQVELDIPMAPDLDIFAPVVIYAPQNQAWASFQPPSWAQQAQVQQVAPQFAVPAEYVAANMSQGYFQAEQPTAPPADAYGAGAAAAGAGAGAAAAAGSYGTTVDAGAGALPPSMAASESDASKPLLG